MWDYASPVQLQCTLQRARTSGVLVLRSGYVLFSDVQLSKSGCLRLKTKLNVQDAIP